MEKAENEYSFRPSQAEDLPFLQSSWGSSYYAGFKEYRRVSPVVFHSFHRPIRERILDQESTTITVCTPIDDQWHILGWVCTEELSDSAIIHYIYVKSAFKGMGIAKELINRTVSTGPVIYTHLTGKAAKIMKSHKEVFNRFSYIPHLV